MQQPTTTTDRTLVIDGMSGDDCVQKVAGALKGVQGVTTQGVEVGSANIAADQQGCDRACSAIGKAGYEAHDAAADDESDAHDDVTPRNDAHAPQRHGADAGEVRLAFDAMGNDRQGIAGAQTNRATDAQAGERARAGQHAANPANQAGNTPGNESPANRNR